MAQSNVSERQAEQGFSIQKAGSVKVENSQDSQLPSVIAGSAAANNLTTSPDLSHICTLCSRKRKSSLTSVQDSTTKDLVLKPYWSDLCAAINSHLLLPVETDSPDLGLNFLSTWLEVTVRVVQPL